MKSHRLWHELTKGQKFHVFLTSICLSYTTEKRNLCNRFPAGEEGTFQRREFRSQRRQIAEHILRRTWKSCGREGRDAAKEAWIWVACLQVTTLPRESDKVTFERPQWRSHGGVHELQMWWRKKPRIRRRLMFFISTNRTRNI